MLNYFAYGSNLHPLRLIERIPSASLAGTAALPGHRMAWHKRGMDDSGKCFIVPTGEHSDRVHGAIFRIDPEHKPLLDAFEGPGYRDEVITLDWQDGALECFTYFARDTHTDGAGLKPFHWYKEIVIAGARHHDFPEDYIVQCLDVDAVHDHDEQRHSTHAALIGRLKTHSGGTG